MRFGKSTGAVVRVSAVLKWFIGFFGSVLRQVRRMMPRVALTRQRGDSERNKGKLNQNIRDVTVESFFNRVLELRIRPPISMRHECFLVHRI